MAKCAGLYDSRRQAALILRDRYNQRELLHLDILPKNGLRQGQRGITLGSGMEGLYRVPVEIPIESWAYEDGATISELPRKKERRPNISLITKANTYADWVKIETLLWSVLSTKWDCWLRIYLPDGSWRELKVRLLNEPPDRTDAIFGRYTNFTWNVNLLAYDPFWYGKPYVFEFTRDDQGDGTPFMTQYSPGFYRMDVPITNPTDVDGWVEWNSGQLTATSETWSFQNGESETSGVPDLIALQALSGANKSFWVRTDPAVPQLWTRDQGQDWANMRSRTFTEPIRPNTPKVRTIRARLQGGTGTSRMRLTLPRRWDRPVGGELPIVDQISAVPA